MKKDKNGNAYQDIGNIRITLVDKSTRKSDKNWSGKDTLRFQSYKDEDNSSLHLGAEIPLENNKTIIELIEVLCKLYAQNLDKI